MSNSRTNNISIMVFSFHVYMEYESSQNVIKGSGG